MEYKEKYEMEDKSVEITLEIKAEYLADADKRKILSFIAKSAHRFYLEAAEKINSKL